LEPESSAYDIFSILTPDITLNLTAYQEYSPVYLSATFSMTFMLAFALSTGLLVHTALYHGPRIYYALRNIRAEAEDIHMNRKQITPNWQASFEDFDANDCKDEAYAEQHEEPPIRDFGVGPHELKLACQFGVICFRCSCL
jgi:hypothetical protein